MITQSQIAYHVPSPCAVEFIWLSNGPLQLPLELLSLKDGDTEVEASSQPLPKAHEGPRKQEGITR